MNEVFVYKGSIIFPWLTRIAVTTTSCPLCRTKYKWSFIWPFCQ